MDNARPLITIDGNRVPFTPGQTILDAARAHGFAIPTLCHLEGLPASGRCGVCVVEIEGRAEVARACHTPAAEGLRIHTESGAAVAARRLALKALLASGDHNCLLAGVAASLWTDYQLQVMAAPWHGQLCPSWGDCRLQDLCVRYGVVQDAPPSLEAAAPLDDDHPMIIRDWSRCIRCGRCEQACNLLQVNQAILPLPKDPDSPEGSSWLPAVDYERCTHCGQCVQACPTGALFERKAYALGRPWETSKVRTTCPYCGVGCQMHLHVKDGRVVKVTAVEDAQPNRGMLCVKGRFGYDFIHSPERLTTPLIKGPDGVQRPASWDQALDLVAERLKAIREVHGADAIGGVSCARSINEDSYNMQKLFRAAIGTNNIDHCARVCHAPTVAGLAASFGSGAMTNSFAEFDRAKLIFVIGSNTTEAHPVAASLLKRAVLNGAQLIVADPRFTGMAEHAHLYVPIKVGSDVAFINGLMHVIIAEGLEDRSYIDAHTEGFAELKAKVAEYPPARAAAIAGISEEMLVDTARRLASAKPAMLVYTLGITEHTCGVNNVRSCANLQMLLGNVGFDCGGVNPLRGQNNVQGACDMGALPGDYPGYQKVADPAARAKFSEAWGAELPERPGLMIPQMFDAILAGELKALWVFGENLANTEPDIHHVERCLEAVDFLVCNDIFPTETTRFADVVFPATAWSEDDGTFTNSERRVQQVRKAVDAPGQSMPNWRVFREVARRLGQEWASDSGQAIWDQEISVLAPALGGIKFGRIEHDGLQWPCPDTNHPGTTCMHRDGCFTCGQGRFAALDWTPPAEVPDADYPLVLSTGRRLYHYHTRTQTGRSQGLNDLLGRETADISLADAALLGVTDGELVRVSSRRGQVVVPAKVTRQVPQGMVWMAFHFREGNANWLTNPVYDPISQTAEYKACAVRVERA